MRPHTSVRDDRLARLLGKSVCALGALLESPDLNLDNLEQGTIDAIELAREVLHDVKAVRDEQVETGYPK